MKPCSAPSRRGIARIARIARIAHRACRALVAFTLLTGAANAAAHASLLASDPVDGARLARSPGVVELQFDEPVEAIRLQVLGPSGVPQMLPPPAGRSERLRIHLPDPLAEGPQVLSYRVTSADAHPVAGTIAFHIGAGASSSRDASSRSGGPPDAHHHAEASGPPGQGLAIALHAARDLALLIAAGAALFATLLRPSTPARGVVRVTAPVAALLDIALLGAHGLALTGTDAMTDAASWIAALHSSFGVSVLMALAGLALLIAGAWLRAPRTARVFLAGGAVLACSSFALTGHAAAARPFWAMPAITLHTLAAAFWLGSLVCLFRLARVDRDTGKDDQASAHALPTLRTALPVFARHAPGAVGVLVLAGAAFATVHLHAPGMLTSTPYGTWLSIKLLLLFLLLCLALYNRLLLTPRIERGHAESLERLRRNVGVELVLLVAILGVTAALSTTPPPRPAPAAPTQSLTEAGRTAQLTFTPDAGGGLALDVELRDQNGLPLAVAAAWIELAQPARGIEPLTRELATLGPGRYRASVPELALPGDWTLILGARLGEFDRVEWRTTLRMP